jgi:microcystin-dependent protein
MTNLQDFTNRSEVGAIKPWGKATAPAGYVLCDGAAISRTTYVELFTVIGTTYGVGNGSSTFNVPDLQGKSPQGYDGNTYNLAGTGGANTVTVSVTNNQAVNSSLANNQSVTVTGDIGNTSLTTAQLASHAHSGMGKHNTEPRGVDKYYPSPWAPSSTPGDGQVGGATPSANILMVPAGSGTAHNHGTGTLAGTLSGTVAITNALTGAVTASGTNSFSPYVVVNYIIKH